MAQGGWDRNNLCLNHFQMHMQVFNHTNSTCVFLGPPVPETKGVQGTGLSVVIYELLYLRTRLLQLALTQLPKAACWTLPLLSSVYLCGHSADLGGPASSSMPTLPPVSPSLPPALLRRGTFFLQASSVQKAFSQKGCFVSPRYSCETALGSYSISTSLQVSLSTTLPSLCRSLSRKYGRPDVELSVKLCATNVHMCSCLHARAGVCRECFIDKKL